MLIYRAVFNMSVPNQKKVIIKKEPCNKDNHYAMINLQSLQKAMQDLKGETFKMWVYLSKNQPQFQLELSYKAAAQFGITKTTYYDVIENLIGKGYLQRKDENSNIYYFTETAFSEIRKDDEEETEYIISEIRNINSEKRKESSENRNEFSDFRQRNITNNIQNTKENTIKKGGKAANNGNLDEHCYSLMKEINKDAENDKFNDEQIKIIKQLVKYLNENKYTETTDNLYSQILSVYLQLYKE